MIVSEAGNHRADEPVDVGEAQGDADQPEGEGTSQSDAGQPEGEAASQSEAAKSRLFLEDGRSVDVDRQTEHFWAQEGIRAAARNLASRQGADEGRSEGGQEPADTSESQEPAAEGDEDDVVGKQLAQLNKKLEQTTGKLSQLEQERQREAEDKKRNAEQQQREQQINRVMSKYAKGADQDTQDMIRDKAARLYNDAAREGRFMSLDEGISAAAKFVGKRLADKHTNWLKGKKEVKDTAAEGPGGGAAISAPVTGGARTKEQERALSREISDGTANKKAMEVWREMMSQAAAT